MSPEMRTVDLPLMTPTRSREDDSRRPSLSGIQEYPSTGQGVLLQFDEVQEGHGELVARSSAKVEEPAEIDSGAEEGRSRVEDEIDEVDLALETTEDVKEAKTNRKVCHYPLRMTSDLPYHDGLNTSDCGSRDYKCQSTGYQPVIRR